MTPATTNDRLTEKTPEASFLHVLQAEFNLSLREVREVVCAAQEHLGLDQPTTQVRAGQVRLVVASLRAPFGPPLTVTGRVTTPPMMAAGPAVAAICPHQQKTFVCYNLFAQCREATHLRGNLERRCSNLCLLPAYVLI